MFCKNCGRQLEENVEICPDCGMPKVSSGNKKEGTNFWFGLVSFLFPVVGLIFFLVWRKEKWYRAKVSGICALVSVIAALVIDIILLVLLIWFISTVDYSDVETTETKITYKSTWNGVLKFISYGDGKEACYDEEMNCLVVWDEESLTAYDGVTKDELFSENYLMDISAVSAYDGVMCVGFAGAARQIFVYDMSTWEYTIVDTQVNVSDLVVTDGLAIYCDGDQWCGVIALNLSSMKQPYILDAVSKPTMAINHEGKLLYVAETSTSGCSLYYVDLATFAVTIKEDGGYNEGDIVYDGEYVHAFGNTYDAYTGSKLSSSGYTEPMEGSAYDYITTLAVNDLYSLIFSDDNHVMVYSREKQKLVYCMHMDATKLYDLGDNQFVAVCGDSGQVAVINLNKL